MKKQSFKARNLDRRNIFVIFGIFDEILAIVHSKQSSPPACAPAAPGIRPPKASLSLVVISIGLTQNMTLMTQIVKLLQVQTGLLSLFLVSFTP